MVTSKSHEDSIMVTFTLYICVCMCNNFQSSLSVISTFHIKFPIHHQKQTHMMQEIMLPHQLYSAARSGGARNVPRFRGLLPHQIINIPSNNPARTRQHGYVQVQERNWFQEDETLILDIVTVPRRENVGRDGGLSERLILKYLNMRDCREVNNDGEPKICVVCQDDLCQENSRIGVVDCGHEYHASCIRQWLQQKNVCPLCKAIALHCPVD